MSIHGTSMNAQHRSLPFSNQRIPRHYGHRSPVGVLVVSNRPFCLGTVPLVVEVPWKEEEEVPNCSVIAACGYY